MKRINPFARAGLALLVAGAFGVPLAGAQSAWAVRYASPSGKASSDCKSAASACDIVTAIHGKPGNVPSLGEEVVLAPGEYTVDEITPGASDLIVRGAPGGARPVIKANEVEAFQASYLTLADLTVEHTGGGYGLLDSGGTLERVLLRGMQAGWPLCQCYGGKLIDSVAVVLPGSTGPAVGIYSNGGTTSETLRNDTLYSESASAGALELLQEASTGSLSLEAINTIAVNAAGGAGVRASARTGITLGSSDFAKPAGAGSISNIGGNVSAPPLFANAAASDFRELPGSPTIDAGVSSAADGALDFEGNARVAGSSTDIGALEYQPPSPPPGSTSTPTKTPSSAGNGIPTAAGHGSSPGPGGSQVALAAILRSKLVRVNARRGTGALTVTCEAPAGRRCTIAGALFAAPKRSAGARRAAKARELGTFAGTLAAGATGRLRLKLTRAGLLALRRDGSYAAVQSAVVSDGRAHVAMGGVERLRVA